MAAKDDVVVSDASDASDVGHISDASDASDVGHISDASDASESSHASDASDGLPDGSSMERPPGLGLSGTDVVESSRRRRRWLPVLILAAVTGLVTGGVIMFLVLIDVSFPEHAEPGADAETTDDQPAPDARATPPLVRTRRLDAGSGPGADASSPNRAPVASPKPDLTPRPRPDVEPATRPPRRRGRQGRKRRPRRRKKTDDGLFDSPY
jgi:hypothetical protein